VALESGHDLLGPLFAKEGLRRLRPSFDGRDLSP